MLKIRVVRQSDITVHAMIKPHVRVVVIEVLRLVARAEIEEMTAVMDELMEQYVDDVVPIAVDVTTELVSCGWHFYAKLFLETCFFFVLFACSLCFPTG